MKAGFGPMSQGQHTLKTGAVYQINKYCTSTFNKNKELCMESELHTQAAGKVVTIRFDNLQITATAK